MPKSLEELAQIIGGRVVGRCDIMISGAADIADAESDDLVFAESPKHLEDAFQSRAAAVITRDDPGCAPKPLILVGNPRYAFARALEVFFPQRERVLGVHPSSVVETGAVLGADVSIGPHCYIGRNTVIGNNVWIHPNVTIQDDVCIGDNCVIYSSVSIYDRVSIGSDVVIHSGAVIGADGFGYTRVGEVHYKIPQVGTVSIEDRVEIGANSTIDRARTGVTRIGAGTKIDNLVHIAHNVTVGENCLVVALTGVSGSVCIGDRAVLAGQTGVKDHVSIGADAVLAARAGVFGDIEAGAFVSGYPARAHKDQLRILAAEQKLPDLLRTIKSLEKRIRELEDRKD